MKINSEKCKPLLRRKACYGIAFYYKHNLELEDELF